MRLQRGAGILLHPTSLPGDFGIGDVGPPAFDLVDSLVEAGQRYWQILPLGPTTLGDSPYSSLSAFAGNTLLISPERLIEDGLLSSRDVGPKPNFAAGRVDYGPVHNWKSELLRKAYRRFQNGSDTLSPEFEAFCVDESDWLDDHALFCAIRATQKYRPWQEWPVKFKLRDERTLAITREQLADEIREHQFYQFIFFRQWKALMAYAAKAGVRIIGDIPIFVALDSADVWSRQKAFKLNSDGSATVVAGVPPDYFSKTGQLWGNPVYDWDAIRLDGSQWWIRRFRHAFEMADIVRVDHFRGFVGVWEVPGDDETAENGSWVGSPGEEIFRAVTDSLGELPVIAEDLGVITPEVDELRMKFGFPGMRILQYAFGGDAQNRDLPHNYDPNTAAYTGTHDNDTIVGWWRSMKTTGDPELSAAQRHCLKYLDADEDEINWKLIKLLYSSVADIAVVPLQDVLGLGGDARMNTPATESGNWQWRFEKGAITDKMIAKLRDLTELYGRI